MNRLIDILREKLEQNLDDFREEMISMDSETVFAFARQIAAMEDVLFYMNTHDWVDEHEAAYLLDFAEPLKLIADAWEEHLDDGDSSFRGIIKTVLNNDENEENYITVALERELREKYGDDVSLKDAVLVEIVETMEEYFELRELYESLGGEFCDEE